MKNKLTIVLALSVLVNCILGSALIFTTVRTINLYNLERDFEESKYAISSLICTGNEEDYSPSSLYDLMNYLVGYNQEYIDSSIFSIFFEIGVEESLVEQVRQKVLDIDTVEKVKYMTESEAYDWYYNQLVENDPNSSMLAALNATEDSLLPSSLEIFLTDKSSSNIQKVSTELENYIKGLNSDSDSVQVNLRGPECL